eukprot:1151441-Pelagomonas_calceolata.AAC.7
MEFGQREGERPAKNRLRGTLQQRSAFVHPWCRGSMIKEIGLKNSEKAFKTSDESRRRPPVLKHYEELLGRTETYSFEYSERLKISIIDSEMQELLRTALMQQERDVERLKAGLAMQNNALVVQTLEQSTSAAKVSATMRSSDMLHSQRKQPWFWRPRAKICLPGFECCSVSGCCQLAHPSKQTGSGDACAPVMGTAPLGSLEGCAHGALEEQEP